MIRRKRIVFASGMMTLLLVGVVFWVSRTRTQAAVDNAAVLGQAFDRMMSRIDKAEAAVQDENSTWEHAGDVVCQLAVENLADQAYLTRLYSTDRHLSTAYAALAANALGEGLMNGAIVAYCNGQGDLTGGLEAMISMSASLTTVRRTTRLWRKYVSEGR